MQLNNKNVQKIEKYLQTIEMRRYEEIVIHIKQ